MGQPNIQPPGYCSGHHADSKTNSASNVKFHNEARLTLLALFDQFVGTGEQRRWHLKAERFGGFEID